MMTALNDWGASWSVWFLSAVVQNTIFLVLVLAALFLLRRASARVLAAVATVGVIKLAIPPFVSTGWFAGGTAEQLAEPVAPLLFPFSEDPGTGGEVVTGLTGGLGLPAVLMLAWVSIMTARLGSANLQSVQLYVELRRSTPVDPEDIPLEMREMGLDIRRSHRVAVPLTMGLFNRRVLVPASWSRWSGDARLAVLRHELAHIRRRDNFIQPIEVLVQAVFFFHPLVHLLIGRLRVWREMACDDLSVGRDPHLRLAYSRFLDQVKEGIMNPVSKLRLTLVVAVLLLAIAPLSLVHGDTPPPPKKPAPVAEPIVSADPAEPESIVKAGEPVPADAPPPPPPSVRVGLSDDGLTVNGKNTPKSEFNDALDKAVTEKGGQVVVSIDSDGAVTMGKVHMMQADLRDLGLYKVIYTGELGEAVPVMLPPDKAREKLASLPPEQVLKVKVNGEGVITVDGKQIDGADLPKLIHKKIAKEPHLVVSLHTESETRYGAFLQTLQGIKKGGADKIAILDPEK
jgi:biopolymer transport protein ExbD